MWQSAIHAARTLKERAAAHLLVFCCPNQNAKWASDVRFSAVGQSRKKHWKAIGNGIAPLSQKDLFSLACGTPLGRATFPKFEEVQHPYRQRITQRRRSRVH
jgi:hypothetical protein